LPEACVISCDNVVTIPLEDFDEDPVGHLDDVTRAKLDAALRYSLDFTF
jgi:mRNA interferase MazF